MAYELPVDLIRQVKTLTRAEAGLSDYYPTGDIQPLPSLSEAVAAFDASPPHLRCKNCKGRLLRGVESVLCIYCGRPNDVPPEPILFKDTLAYRWLLESLNLDGSEMVGPTTERSEFNRGQSTPKGQIPLSDFLNLKITWPSEVEKKEIVLNKQTQERSSLNLTGVDLDNFFSESLMLYVSEQSEEDSLRYKHVEAAEVKESTSQNNLSFFENMHPSNLAVLSSESKDGAETAEAKEFTSRDDLSFFENVKPVELAAHTSNDKEDNAISGWESTFQSAQSGNQLDNSKTFDPFISSAVSSGDQSETSKPSDPFGGSTADLSSQLDSVFGPGAALKDEKTQVGAEASSSTEEWNDDLWNNLSSNVSQQMGQPDSSVGVENVVPQDAKDFDWFEVNQSQSNNANAPSGVHREEEDDSFIDWNDFTSSTSVNVAPENSATRSQNQPITTSAETSDLNLFSTDNKFEEIGFGSFLRADPFASSSSKENVSTSMTVSGLEVSSSGRVVDSDSDTSRGPEQSAIDGDVKTAGREEVERILSQMHDLSFMLENNLSLPPKSNNLHS